MFKLIALLNKLAGIIDKWTDEFIRTKYRNLGQDEGRGEVVKSNNELVQGQLDSARAGRAGMATKTDEEVDAILDQGLKS